MQSRLILFLPVLIAATATSGAVVALPMCVAGGDAHRGAKLIAGIGCGACHAIPGIEGAEGKVGPPLEGVGERVFIAGVLPNTPENMIAWIKAPQAIVPGNAMPDLGLSDAQARDIAAYLYTLR